MNQEEIEKLSKHIDTEKRFKIIHFGLSVALTVSIFFEDRLSIGLSVTLVCFSFFNLLRSHIFDHETQLKNLLFQEKFGKKGSDLFN